MEKKRKRASFSPTFSVETTSTHHDDKTKEDAKVKQVVEVVVEEQEEDGTDHEEHTHNPHINIVMSPTEVVSKEKEVKKESPIEEASVVEKEDSKSDESEEEDRPTQHVEVIDDDEEEEQEKSRSEESTQTEEEDAEEQKETVAELFGKGSESGMPEITVHKSKNTRGLILWGIMMVAIALGVGGGLIFFTSRNNGPQSPIGGATPTETPSIAVVAPTATPTPIPVKKSDLKVQVMNGGGVVGAGSKMKALLEGKGYKVTDVRNADSYGYDTTEISVKASKSEALPLVKTDVGDSYEIGKSDTTLEESSPYDVRVIVGKK